MQVSTLSADPDALRIVSLTDLSVVETSASNSDSITIVARTFQPFGQCPNCQTWSSSLHSYYVRQLADLPWHGVSIRIELHTRKFRCRNEFCQRKIFCERLPKVVESYGRKTVLLQDLFGVLAFVLGGQGGSKTAREIGLSVSGDTLLRRIRRISQPIVKAVKVLGVDDFAFRRGHLDYQKIDKNDKNISFHQVKLLKKVFLPKTFYYISFLEHYILSCT